MSSASYSYIDYIANISISSDFAIRKTTIFTMPPILKPTRRRDGDVTAPELPRTLTTPVFFRLLSWPYDWTGRSGGQIQVPTTTEKSRPGPPRANASPRRALAAPNPRSIRSVMQGLGCANWTVFQRMDVIQPHQDFYLGWANYKQDFYDQPGEFWCGSEDSWQLDISPGPAIRPWDRYRGLSCH